MLLLPVTEESEQQVKQLSINMWKLQLQQEN